MPRLDINLSCFNNFLQNFGVLSRQLLHFALLGDVLTALLVVLCLLGVVPVDALPNSLLGVLVLNSIELLAMFVETLQPLKLAEEVALLDNHCLLSLLPGH